MLEQQQTGKRSIALPITLILLVFSLIGNVFLYSLYLQHKQGEKFDAGQQIYGAALESLQYFEELIPQLDALIQSQGVEERLHAKFLAGKSMQKGLSFEVLAEKALELNGQSDKPGEDQTDHFLENVEAALQTIGSYAGPLTAADQTYLLTLKQSLEAMHATLSTINLNIEDNRNAIIRLASGVGWVEKVEKVELLMRNDSAELTKTP